MNRILFLLAGLFLIASDTTRTALAADSPPGQPLNMVATLPVLKDFAEQIGGENVNGAKVREMLRAGTLPPPEFSRPEVAKVLIDAMKTK